MSTISTLHNTDAAGLDARTIRELAREAMRRACGSQKAAAIELEIEQAQLSRQLAGVERFALDSLAKSPRICEEFAFLLAQHLGYQPRSPSVQERRRQQMRMLKMQLTYLLDEELSEAS